MWSCRSRSLACAALVGGLLTATASSAVANPRPDCSGQAGILGGGGEAGAECHVNPPADTAPSCDRSSGVVAWYGEPPSGLSETYLRIIMANPPPEGMMLAAAYNCAGRYLGGPHLVADPAFAAIRAVRDRARARLSPPAPAVHVSPSRAVTRLPTWLWVDRSVWVPSSASASAGAVTVRVEARPTSSRWDLGEGSRVCDGPGIAWSQPAQDAYDAQPAAVRGRGNPACTYTFVHSSSVTSDGVYHASVTVSWEFSWWLNGQPQGSFGTVDRRTDFDLQVGEVEALITAY